MPASRRQRRTKSLKRDRASVSESSIEESALELQDSRMSSNVSSTFMEILSRYDGNQSADLAHGKSANGRDSIEKIDTSADMYTGTEKTVLLESYRHPEEGKIRPAFEKPISDVIDSLLSESLPLQSLK